MAGWAVARLALVVPVVLVTAAGAATGVGLRAADACAPNMTDGMLAASGPDFGALGDFEQCREIPAAKFCTVKEGLPLRAVTIGVCVPTDCPPTAVPTLLQQIFGIGGTRRQSIHCQAAERRRTLRLTPGQHAVVAAYAALALCCAGGTALLARRSAQAPDASSQPLLLLLPGESSSPTAPYDLIGPSAKAAAWGGERRGAPADILACFALQTTWRSLTSPFTGDTHCLHALRTGAMVWVILAHTMYFVMDVHSIQDKERVTSELLPSFFFVLVPTADLAVDCFFWLSGYLATFHLVAACPPPPTTGAPKGLLLRGVRGWLLLAAYRYLRLTPLYALLLATFWQLLPLAGVGPLWPHVQDVISQCDGYWWTNLLYVNNFHPREIDRSCMSWAWYLADDFQFSLAAPLFAALYHAHRPAGAALVLGLLAVSLWSNDVYYFGDPFKERPYCRMAPYLYGVATAFALNGLKAPSGAAAAATAAGEEEEEGRGLASLRERLRDPMVSAAVYTTAAALLGSAVVLSWYGFSRWLQGVYLPLWVQKFTAVYQRLVWGPGLTLLLLPSLLGGGAGAARVTERRGWAVLARLTYAAYLVHPMCMMVYFGNGYNSPVLTRWRFLWWFLLFTATSYLVAAALFLLCEGPFIALQRRSRRPAA